MRCAVRGTAIVIVALLLLVSALPLPASGATTRPSGAAPRGPGGADLGEVRAGSTFGPPSRDRLPSVAAERPLSGPRNVLVVAPCETAGNAEVEQAYDAARGYLYEAWIGCGGIGFSRSLDGGYSFQPAVAVPGSRTIGGMSWDPSIALAPNGTVYVAYMVNNGSGDAPAVAWSWDHGATFANWTLATRPNTTEFSDRDFIAVAPNGTIDLTWDDSPNGSMDLIGCAPGGSCYFLAGDYNVVLSHSSDGGRTWSNPVAIDPRYPNGGSVAAPLVVEPNGTIDVLFESYDVSGPNHTLGLGYNYFSRSNDGGATWSLPLRVANLSFPNTTWWIDGDLARDAGGGLYATFDSQSGASDTAWVVVSHDNGTSWGSPLRVNPDVNTATHALVGVAGGPAGIAYIAWMANNSTAGWSTFESRLTVAANGSTFGAPIRASEQVGIPGYWIGDTLGVSWLGGNASAVSWSYGVTLNGTNNSEVYAAVVGIPPPGAPSIVSIVPGVARVTLAWNPPISAPVPSAYVVAWAIEGSPTGQVSVPAPNTSVTVAGLLAGARYSFTVTAWDPGGAGPPSGAANITLSAWEVVAGNVEPAGLVLHLDGAGVPVVAGQYSVNTTYTAHLLTAIAHDYQPYQLALPSAWNATVWANVTLSLLGGSVRGTVFPALSEVTWDGTPVVVTSGTFSVGAAGNTSHVLRATYLGFAARNETLLVPPNATLYANLTLRPLDGHFGLTVRPVNASVRVNASPVALDPTGYANVSLAPGTYAVEAAAPGYIPYFTNWTLLPGQWRNLTIALAPASNNSTTGPGGGGGSGGLGGLVANPALWAVIGVLAVALVVIVALARRRNPPDTGGAESYRAEPIGSEDAPLPELPEGPT